MAVHRAQQGSQECYTLTPYAWQSAALAVTPQAPPECKRCPLIRCYVCHCPAISSSRLGTPAMGNHSGAAHTEELPGSGSTTRCPSVLTPIPASGTLSSRKIRISLEAWFTFPHSTALLCRINCPEVGCDF